MSELSPFLHTLSNHLDAIEAALVLQDPAAVALACQQLQQLLLERARQPSGDNWTSSENRQAAAAIEQRMKTVRQTLLQQSAAASRALAALLPDDAPNAYGRKPAFGMPLRGPNTKVYQA